MEVIYRNSLLSYYMETIQAYVLKAQLCKDYDEYKTYLRRNSIPIGNKIKALLKPSINLTVLETMDRVHNHPIY